MINFTKISEHDAMLPGKHGIQHYFSVGFSGIAIIHKALEKYNVKTKCVLDIPCGHGRITRFLKATLPSADIWNSDINKNGVDFCCRTFQTKGLYSTKNFSKLIFPEDIKFDLIWVGSLITHFPPELTSDFIRFCLRNSSPEGIIILTNHGKFSYENIDKRKYGLTDEQILSVKSNYLKFGYGYSDYLNTEGYGISLIDPDYFEKIAPELNFKILDYFERAWDNHHDIIIIQKKIR